MLWYMKYNLCKYILDIAFFSGQEWKEECNIRRNRRVAWRLFKNRNGFIHKKITAWFSCHSNWTNAMCRNKHTSYTLFWMYIYIYKVWICIKQILKQRIYVRKKWFNFYTKHRLCFWKWIQHKHILYIPTW